MSYLRIDLDRYLHDLAGTKVFMFAWVSVKSSYLLISCSCTKYILLLELRFLTLEHERGSFAVKDSTNKSDDSCELKKDHVIIRLCLKLLKSLIFKTNIRSKMNKVPGSLKVGENNLDGQYIMFTRHCQATVNYPINAGTQKPKR